MKQPTPIWRGKVKQGKIQLERRADFAALKMRLEGQEIELVLRKFRRQRSLPKIATSGDVFIRYSENFAGTLPKRPTSHVSKCF